MSEMIVQVRNKILRRIGGVNHFVSHNKDYTIQFQFDESWDNVRTKMAVFAYEDGEYGSEIFDGDTCNVPELPREGRILIGVKAGEDLSTELLCIPVCIRNDLPCCKAIYFDSLWRNLFTGSRTSAHRGLVHRVFLSRCCQKRMDGM